MPVGRGVCKRKRMVIGYVVNSSRQKRACAGRAAGKSAGAEEPEA